jgi:hypothetical protein
MGKFRIVIEVEGGTHRVKVTDDAWNEKVCNSVLVVAGNEVDRTLYLFGWGHPKTVAWALGEGLSQAQSDPWYEALISCLCRDMAMRTMPIGEPTTVQKIERRWSEEDSLRLQNIDLKKVSH